jgi:urease accessory protein
MAEVALVAAQASASGPAWAATRLLGLDPFAVGRCLAGMAGPIDAVAAEAVAATAGGAPLPAYSAPLTEIGAERHARWEVRLFAS